MLRVRFQGQRVVEFEGFQRSISEDGAPGRDQRYNNGDRAAFLIPLQQRRDPEEVIELVFREDREPIHRTHALEVID